MESLQYLNSKNVFDVGEIIMHFTLRNYDPLLFIYGVP